ncbi:MAG: hypothetical protein HRT71_04340 [Flavobacteriales bacterium]|nr:hypothetical protein [Flavobacteriales bacterium]
MDIYDLYKRMENHNIMLSFSGEVTGELLDSLLAIVESKLETVKENPKIKRKVYNVLVECLQNLYHHSASFSPKDGDATPAALKGKNSTIFMMGRDESLYNIMSGNYIKNEDIEGFKAKLDKINGMDKEGLKAYYKEVLNNAQFSAKGGGGLGMIDIAKKTGQKLNYTFEEVDSDFSFFTLNIQILQI